MKKILTYGIVAIISFLAFCAVFYIGSSTSRADETDFGDDFVVVSKGRNNIVGTGDYYILADKETNVMYLYVSRYYADTITVLLDSDGKPLLYEEEKNDR